jgi:ATP/maltotriose-dependent transcriptional regulator MalT/DNA-binding SARP family transcriptional activator
MQQSGPIRAKLTRPRLHHAVARERLFAKLDAARSQRRATCVVGPPGAGKTTLVASWSDARAVKGIWYQVDAGDADLATFFFYLGEAARPFLRKGRRPLPALTPEYLHDIPGFARRFFRDLFALLPADSSVVLDNYQEVPAEEAFHQIVADAVGEVPEGQALVAITRRDPPNCYARLIANDNVAFVDWEDLRLTLDETSAIIGARGTYAPGEIEQLHTESGGWAAGVTLMLEGRRRRGAGAVPDPQTERDILFDYFAAQIFEQVPRATQRFLMITSLLPQVPVSLARELTGEPAAAEILEQLYQRHLFTHRRPGQEPTYWYHALFRRYLAAQGERVLTVAERRELESRAARLLEAAGACDDAFVLFRQAQDWDSIARLAERQAEEMLGHGRGQVLRDWILALPAERLEQDPWLRYWLGTSVIPIDQREARVHLQAAFALFAACGDRRGQALAAAGVLDTYYFEWSDFGPMGLWVQRLEPFIEENLFASEPDRELKLFSSMLAGIFYGAPRHRMLRPCVARVSEMLDEKLDVNSKLKAATFLLSYCNLAGELDLARSVYLRVASLLDSPDVTPLNELWWFLRLGHYHTMVGDLQAARDALDHVRAVAHAHGLHGLRSAALLIRSYELVVKCMEADLEAAQRLVAETEALAVHSRPMDTWHVVQGRAYLAVLRRDAESLRRWGRAAYVAAQSEGMVYTEVLGLLHEAHGLATCADRPQLEAVLRTAEELIAGTFLTYFECEVRFLRAYAALGDASRTDALAATQDAVRHARERDYHYPNMLRFSATLPGVLGACLEAGVEAEYAREVIRRYRLRPPREDMESWPWPVRIHTLGRFEVQLDDVLLRFTGKTPRKPLALLKAIVAHGCIDVPQARLIDALWPDEEGDAGRQSFGVTMVRLRKLLGHHDAVLVADERVSLNPALCWVDAHAFEAKLKGSEERAASNGPEAVSRMQEALVLYNGPFLPSDAEAAWSVQMRLRLRGLFTAAVEDLGARHETAGEWERAIACYRRGLEADDLVEEFYLGQMRCYLALQRPAEGMAVFRRLRQTLSVVLGVSPSPASEAAARALSRSGQPVDG